MSDFNSLLNSFKKNAAESVGDNRKRKRSAVAPSKKIRGRTTSDQSSPTTTPLPSDAWQLSRGNESPPFRLGFLCIGAQKAGTTWLHSLLTRCPRIALPLRQKEVHFWDWHRCKGLRWYADQFPEPNMSASVSSSAPSRDGHPPNPICGEITPCYAVLPPTSIAELSRLFPNLCVVFLARDLVQRVWSAMVMELQNQTLGLRAGDFAEGAVPGSKAKAKIPNGVQSAAVRRRLQQQASPSAQPDSYYIDRLRHSTHSSRSNYALHLRNWYQHFSSDKILILRYEDLESDPRGLVERVVRHVGLEEDEANAFVEGLKETEVRRRVNAATAGSGLVNDKASQLSQTSLSTRPILKRNMETILRPYARDFNALLKEKDYDWRLDEYA